MKIVYITNARIPTEKAHGLQIMKSCEAFAKMGIDVELVIPRRLNDIKEEVFSYYGAERNFRITKIPCLDLLGASFLLGKLSFYILSVTFSISAIFYIAMKKGKNTLIYCRDPIILFPLCLIGFNPIAELHDYKSEKPRRTVRFILDKSSKIVVNSSGTLGKIKRHYDINDKKVMVAPNGVDPEFFNIDESKEEARKLLNIPQGSRIIAYVGRIETAGTDKGVGLLIKSFATIKDRVTNMVLYIIGGPNELAENYNKQALSLGIDSSAIMFTGFVPFRRVPLYLRAIDVVIVPLPKGKHAETTSPIKIFEFMAAGKAIIAPDFPSLREYIDEENAIFFSPDNQNDLAEKIMYALDNPDLIKNKGQKSLEFAQKFTWQKRARNIIDFINR